MFKNLSLRLKLVLAFLFIAALLVVVTVYQINSMQLFGSRVENLRDTDLSRLNTLEDLSLTSATLSDRYTDYQQTLTGTAASRTKAQTELMAQTNNLANSLRDYKDAASSTDHVSKNVSPTAITKNGDQVVTLLRATLSTGRVLSKTDQQALDTAKSEMNEAIDSAISADRHEFHETTNQIIKLATERQFTIGVMAVLFAVIAGVIGIILASRIGRSITKLGSGAERIANGDFSQEIETSNRDEIGQVGVTFNRMAQRLRESYGRLALEQQRDEAILKGMGEGMIAIDEKGRIVIINHVAADLLELDDEATIIGESIKDAYPLYKLGTKDTKLPADQRPSFQALKTGQPVEDVYAFHMGSGAKRQLNIAASPFKVDGKVVGVVTIIRDVTKEKEVDRMKTEFISLASHQLRTPLSAIKWFSEMLINGDAGKLKSEQLEFAHNIADSTERMIALVTSLLNISRIESGRIMIVPQPTDLKELVGGIVNDLKGKTEEKKQDLIISVHAGLPKIDLDPRLIGQVYLNLLTNAIKYTPKGGEISVFISKKDDMIISQITDNGYGIPKEQQGRMFEKFFRAANAVKVETDGTGLGLYLIKTVVESSGGKIWFESEENKGSTFWFTIPLSGMKAREGEVTLDI